MAPFKFTSLSAVVAPAPLPTRHCQALPRRNGLVIVIRGRKMHPRVNFCISVPHDIPIISQKNAHVHSKEAQSKNFTSTNKKFAPSGACVVLMKRAGLSPGASGCRVQVPGDVPELEYALRAFWRCQPRRNWFSLGLSAHHLCIDADPAAD